VCRVRSAQVVAGVLGGLGVLAGDLLKEASDQALPLVGVGLFYRKGYFHQRVDRRAGNTSIDRGRSEALPAVRVTTPNGSPLAIRVPIWDGHVTAHVWRIDLGRVPLYLLDAEIAENSHCSAGSAHACTKATAPSVSRSTRSWALARSGRSTRCRSRRRSST